jgi:hypothetical protein
MTEVDVTYVFDEILGRHMERLFGSRHGIGGLPLQIGTIACLTLLADQVERGQNGQASGEENTAESLEAKLAELGFQDKEKVQSVIQEMKGKGYIVTDEQGKITGGKPAVSMAKLLERVFPKLPGKTLVAYFIQTIDEVLTGRKTTEVAVTHFDQTLKMQGLPLKTRKSEKPEAAQGADRKQRHKTENVIRETQDVPRSTFTPLAPPVEDSGGIRIIGSAEDGFRYRVRDIKKISPSSPEPSALMGEQVLQDQPEAAGITADQSPEPQPPAMERAAEQAVEAQPSLEGPAEQPVEAASLPAESTEGHPPEVRPLPVDSHLSPPPEASPPDSGPETETVPGSGAKPLKADSPAPPPQPQGEETPQISEAASVHADVQSTPPEQAAGDPEATGDDLVEKEIAGFQDELASLCPLCREGKVREEKTGTGKPYYKCSNKACSLVSWGRPHHVSCPVCGNPFLVEMSAGHEKCRLQCPRATCKYQCTLSEDQDGAGMKTGAPAPGAGTDPGGRKPRRRVVRRRVVRKRKS